MVLTAILRQLPHAVQFAGAVAACILYVANYEGVDKDYRWNFAITICAFTITGSTIQSVFIGCFRRHFDDGWIVLSGLCSGLLFIFWTGVLGTFAARFIHMDPTNNNGIRMMQIAVYIDAANMVIWFLTVVYMIVLLSKYERPVTTPGRTAEELLNGTHSSTGFVPYGWDTLDLEEGSSAVETETLPLPPMIEVGAAHRNTPLAILPPPPPIIPAASGRNVANVLALLPDDPQLPPPTLPPIHHQDSLHSLIQLSRPYPPQSNSRVYRHSSHRAAGQSKYEQVDEKDHPLSSENPRRNSSWPLGFDIDEPTKECPICAEEHPCWTGFPSKIARACSSHEQEACRNCIARSIAAEIDGSMSGQIHCFECRAVLEYQEVKALASPATFEKYEAKGIMSFVSNDPNFVWCQSQYCEAGQEHVGGIDQPIVTCQSCGFKTCFKHHIPWHENMLCDEYDTRLPLSDDERRTRAQQELASVAAVHQVSKPCANRKCRAPIEKDMGCDHMTCRACKHEFCWVCGVNWGGRHRVGCGHR